MVISVENHVVMSRHIKEVFVGVVQGVSISVVTDHCRRGVGNHAVHPYDPGFGVGFNGGDGIDAAFFPDGVPMVLLEPREIGFIDDGGVVFGDRERDGFHGSSMVPWT